MHPVRATGRVGDVEFEFEVPPEMEEMLRVDPEGFEIGFRGQAVQLGQWVMEPCAECGHDRTCHRLGVGPCARCSPAARCAEWWKL